MASNYVDFTVLVSRISNFLGFGMKTYDELTADQLAQVYECLDDGYNEFLIAHNWTFTRKYATLATVADQATNDLPSDFASLCDKKKAFRYDSDNSYSPVVMTSVGHIEQMKTGNDITGRPMFGALRYKDGFTGAALQVYQVLWYPVPDAAYTLAYHYNIVLPTQIRTATPYPIGTQIHGRTILEFCLAAAERILDDTAQIHAQKAQEFLAVSIQNDAKNAPATLGRNADLSHDQGLHVIDDNKYVTVEGTLY